VVVCKTGQALPQVPLPLLSPIPLDGVVVGGAILLPVAGMVGAPLASAVAADLAILFIESQLLLTVLVTALPLTRFVRTGSLLQVKSGWFELPVAETATPLLHPFRVGCAFSIAWTRHLPPRENSQLEKNKSTLTASVVGVLNSMD
jgi:hypothetical protein